MLNNRSQCGITTNLYTCPLCHPYCDCGDRAVKIRHATDQPKCWGCI